MNIIDNPTDMVYPNFDVPRRPAHIARYVMDAHYGLTTPYGEPDEEGREGFERAQAETLAETGEFIDADTVLELIKEGIEADRRGRTA